MSADMLPELAPRLWRGEEMTSTLAPFDVRETKDKFVFTADLPGIKEEDLDINVTGNRLTVSGKREAEVTEESDRYYCSERVHGSFSRSFTLPEGVQSDKIQADLKNGVLTLSVPKTGEAQPRRISISAGQKKQ